jgi:hypothetical protein
MTKSESKTSQKAGWRLGEVMTELLREIMVRTRLLSVRFPWLPFFFLTFLWILLSRLLLLFLLLPLLFSQYLQALLQYGPVIPPFRVLGEKGQFSCLAFNRMYTFLSSLPVMSIKAKERYMFLSLSLSHLSVRAQSPGYLPPVFDLDFVAFGQVSLWYFKFLYLTKSWAFRPFLYATKHLVFQWLAKGVAVPSQEFPSVYLAVTFLS